MRRFLFVIALALLSGCASISEQQASKSSAYFVGDRATIELNPIVVTIEVPGQPHVFKNLNVNIAAAVESDRILSGYDDIRMIVMRSQPRIAAAVIDEATRTQHTGQLMSDLNTRITNRVQKTFQPIFAEWKDADGRRVTLFVTALYFSEKTPPTGRMDFYY